MVDYFSIETLLQLPLAAQICAAVLVVLLAAFILLFLIPGILLRRRLLIACKKLDRLTKKSKVDLAAVFSQDRRLVHLWSEFAESLHEQRELDPSTGVQEIVALRSTVPAEAFFSSQSVVDSRLSTEFFKHLPGIFTGIGIIGTFTGLILGLNSFTVSESPSVVRASLEGLLHGVWEAFLVSASAITLAMGVTLLEKLTLASLYRHVEALAQRLDALFEAGAGEEYLSRLVRAAEDSSSQTRILKDALVADLKQILTELTEKQIAAQAQSNTQLAQTIAVSLQDGLKTPLDTIAAAVNQVGQDQGSAVTRLLTDVLSGFSQRLQELFGGQISGINELQQQTVQALQTAVARMEQMATNVEQASQRTSDAMAEKIAEAISGIEARQKVLADGLNSFIAQMKALVEQSQSESSAKLSATLELLGEKVADMVGAIQSQSEAASRDQEQRLRAIASQTDSSLSGIGAQLQSLSSAVSESASAIQEAASQMRSTTIDAISRLNAGAETLYIAASDFAKAGVGVKGSLDAAAGVTNQLTQASGSIAGAMRSLEGIVADYRATRDTAAQMIEQLRAVIESCRREAAVTEDVLSRIEGATTGLVHAHAEADDYMQRISEVLGQGFDQFSQNLTKVVEGSNTEFYKQLSLATGLLREGIQELESTLAAVPVRQAE